MTNYDHSNQIIEVLIVEDDVRIAEMNRRLIEKVEGYQVIGIATNENEAKEQLEIMKPNLLILDVYFPDMNGIVFLSFTKNNYPDTDVIMFTAANEVETIYEAIRLGVFDFITKPVVFDRFYQTLEKYQHFFNKLKVWKAEKGRIEQSDIDELLHVTPHNTEPVEMLKKGIDRITYTKVLNLLNNEGEDLTADQVGQKIGSSRSTARRYLEFLVGEGIVTADLTYGVVGRPVKTYRKNDRKH